MSEKDIIRAWKDEEYRLGLGAGAPANPAGLVELTDEALDDLIAGAGSVSPASCCWSSCNTRQTQGAGLA